MQPIRSSDEQLHRSSPIGWPAGIGLWAVLLIAALVYWPGLRGPLILDDIDNLYPLHEAARGELAWQVAVFGNAAGPLGRPVAMLSLLGNWVASGGDVWTLKYTNLMLHLLSSTLVFWLTGRLLRQPAACAADNRWWLALWVVAAWAWSPLLVSSVLYVVQRMALLAALFSLAGLLSYVVGRQNLAEHFSRGVMFVLAAFLLFLPLASLSKENGLLLPLLAFVLELFFFRFEGDRRTRRFLLGVFGFVLVVPALVLLGKLFIQPEWVTGGYANRDFTLGERLLTEPRILFAYASDLMVPQGAHMGLYHDDYVKSTGVLSPPATLLAVVGLGLLLIVGVWKRRTRTGLVAAGLWFFLAGHAMESTIFPLELYFEHRSYLPSLGIFLSLGLAAYYLSQTLPHRRVIAVLLMLLPMGYAGATYQRAMTWRSWEGIALAAKHSHPNSARLHADLAVIYMNSGGLSQALEHLDRVDALAGAGRNASGAALQRLLSYCLNDVPVPVETYARLEAIAAVDEDPYTINALERLVKAVGAGRCGVLDRDRLIASLERWSASPDRRANKDYRWNLLLYTGTFMGMSGRKRPALRYLQSASDLFPEEPVPALLALNYQLALGDIDAARDTLSQLKLYDKGARKSVSEAIALYEDYLSRLSREPAEGSVETP